VAFAKTQRRHLSGAGSISLFECVLSLVLHEKMAGGIGKL